MLPNFSKLANFHERKSMNKITSKIYQICLHPSNLIHNVFMESIFLQKPGFGLVKWYMSYTAWPVEKQHRLLHFTENAWCDTKRKIEGAFNFYSYVWIQLFVLSGISGLHTHSIAGALICWIAPPSSNCLCFREGGFFVWLRRPYQTAELDKSIRSIARWCDCK